MTMKALRRLGILLVGMVIVATLAPTPTAAARTVTLDGVRVAIRSGTTQVVTVNRTSGWHARVVLWEHSARGWRAVKRTAHGAIGYGGLVAGTRRRQGTGTTPSGTYRLLGSFGTHTPQHAWHLAYRRIAAGDYWVEDNGSRYYNRYRNRSQGGFRWKLTSGENSSEELTDYPRQYELSITTSFNYSAQVRHRGAGIFLHVNGRGATAGCASATRTFMVAAMKRLDPKRVPLIAIGR
jgi:L,D-peptidoglycan transpeptidase YkuD (ErfK/YbiS/YcfS/YnhG family)